MGSAEIEAFLTHFAVEKHVAASTQNQAQNAVVFSAGFHERAFWVMDDFQLSGRN